MADARFPATDPAGHWWLPTGRVYLSPDPDHTPAEELGYAREHFFQARRYRNPFGFNTTVELEGPYDLLMRRPATS